MTNLNISYNEISFIPADIKYLRYLNYLNASHNNLVNFIYFFAMICGHPKCTVYSVFVANEKNISIQIQGPSSPRFWVLTRKESVY